MTFSSDEMKFLVAVETVGVNFDGLKGLWRMEYVTKAFSGRSGQASLSS
jgi:hypothetical protein